tara:strand:- start:1342 stop:2739 length:1398 start_codon:yes stop_codon:yes gene_type:complete
MIKEKFRKKSFLIVGLGISGISLHNFLKNQKIKVLSWDDNELARKKAKNKGISITQIESIDYSNIDFIVFSPGVASNKPNEHPIVKKSKKFNCLIISDLDLIYFLNYNYIKIGITGTNGKSTTTSCVNHICNMSQQFSLACGNIGKPFSSLKFDRKIENLIVEASSYQLERLKYARFNISLLLNISKDHLERHKNMKNYINAKLNIFKKQEQNDFAIISIDNYYTRKIVKDFKMNFKSNLIQVSCKKILKNGLSVVEKENKLIIQNNISNQSFMINKNDLKGLDGNHNLENIIATYAICHLLKISDVSFKKYLKTFKGLAHRFEYVATFGKIMIFNDSKATNVESSKVALSNLKNIFWILGGRPKSGGINGIEKYLHQVKMAFIFGEAKDNFSDNLKKHIKLEKFKKLRPAFEKAINIAKEKDEEINILFSPACSSFDQFKNFEERGNYFKKIVKLSLKTLLKNE